MSDEDSQALEQGHLGDGNDGGQEPSVDAEDTSGGKLYAGKYKTAEELERAYQEAQRKMHESTTKAQLLEQRFNNFEQQLRPQATAEETRQRMVEAFEADPVGFIQQFGQGIMQQTQVATEQKMNAQMAVNAWITKNPEFADPRKQQMVDYCIQNYVNTNPETAYLSAADKLQRAGEMVKEFLREEVTNYQKTQVQRDAEIKKMAAMETGQPGNRPGPISDNKEPTYDDYLATRRKEKEKFLQREG
jgi:flagellar biosynthesis chaperone FliJ